MSLSRRKFIRNLATGLFVPTLMDSALHASSGLGFWNITGSAFSWDADVLDWISRVQGQGSDTSTNTRLAVNSFVLAVKSYTGLWTKLKRIGVYAGDDINAVKAPLKKDWGGTNDGVASFAGGDYSESTGLTGTAGSQKGIATGVVMSAVATINDIHVSFYSRTATQEAHTIVGTVDGGSQEIELLARYAANTSYFAACSNSQYATGADTSGAGWYLGSRTASNSQKLYRNGSLLGTNTTPAGTLPTTQMTFHCQNASNISGDGSSKALSFYSLGLGLDATDASNLYPLIQTLQTALSRQV